MRKYWVISSPPCKADITKEMNKEKDFVYLVTVVQSTLHDVWLAVLLLKIKVTRSKTKYFSLYINILGYNHNGMLELAKLEYFFYLVHFSGSWRGNFTWGIRRSQRNNFRPCTILERRSAQSYWFSSPTNSSKDWWKFAAWKTKDFRGIIRIVYNNVADDIQRYSKAVIS